MKKITVLTLMLLIGAFTFHVSAQSSEKAKRSKVAEKEVVKSEKVDQVKPAPEAGRPEPQSTEQDSPKPKSKGETDGSVIVKPAPKPKTKTNEEINVTPVPSPRPKTDVSSTPNQEADVKGPSVDKRMHAEERSNGHAFSGRGKGADKNLVDPVAPAKKAKTKAKKNKKNTIKKK